MATLDEILALGNIPLVDPVSNRLPGGVEATLPAAVGKGVAGGVAALNGSGVPITSQGVPMAVIGTVSGTAADAAAVASALAGKAVIGTTSGTAADAGTVATALAGKASASAIPPEANTERHIFPAGSPLAWPARPAWQGPVVFNAKGQTVTKPGNDGVITGGGGMVPLLDEYRT